MAPDPQHRSTATTSTGTASAAGTSTGTASTAATSTGTASTATASPGTPADLLAGDAGRVRRARAVRASVTASAASTALRRRGTKTPGCSVIRRPANSTQPRTCSSGSPPIRRSRSVWSSAADPPAARS